MAISDKINSIKTHIGEAYTAIQGKEGTIPANKNCENLKDAIASIPTSGKTQEKTVNITENGVIITTPDTGYDGMSSVTTVTNVQPDLQEKAVTPTESQQIITPDAGYDGLNKVTVDAIQTKEASVTPAPGQQVLEVTDNKYYKKVTVEAIPPNYVIPSGTIQITENGVVDVSGKATANVNVPSKEEETKTVDLAMALGNQTINPTSGKTLSQVVVKKPATMLPENIKKDVNIGGVTGTLESGGGGELNIAYGDTAPEDTSKLWIKSEEPSNISFPVVWKPEQIVEGITDTGVTISPTRSSIGSAAVGTKIYLFGGRTASSEVNTIQVFDTTNNTVKTLTVTLPKKTAIVTAATVGTKIYLFLPDYSIYVFDTTNNTIEPLTTKLSSGAGAYNFGVGVVGTKIYLFGGWTATSPFATKSIQVFDTTNNTVETLTTTLPEVRESLGSAAVGTKIYLFGGRANDIDYTQIYVFNTVNNTIKTLQTTTMNAVDRGSAAVGTKIYLFGGGSYQYTKYKSIQVFDTTDNTIEKLTTTLPEAATNINAVTVGTKIYLVNYLNGFYQFTVDVPLSSNDIIVTQEYYARTFKVLKAPTEVEVACKYVYKGDQNLAKFIDAYLYDGANWVNVNTGHFTLTKLYAPKISISDKTLTITNDSRNGSKVTSYEIYKDGVLLTTITNTSFDLSSLISELGTYAIAVKAVGTNVEKSELSNEAKYICANMTYAANQVAGDTSLTTSVNCQVGDLVVAAIIVRSALTLPDGWTLVSTSNTVSGDSTNQTLSFAYKVATSTSESIVVTQATSGRIYTTLCALQGAKSVTDIGYTYSTTDTKNSLTVNKTAGVKLWAASNSLWASSAPYGDWTCSADTKYIAVDQAAYQPRLGVFYEPDDELTSVTFSANGNGYITVGGLNISYEAAAGYNVTVSSDGSNHGFDIYDGQSASGTKLGRINGSESINVVCTSGYLYFSTSDGGGIISVTGGVTEVDWKTVKVTGDGTVTASYSCLIEGTQITLADGTTKAIEDITYDDELLVWNFYDGKFDTAKPTWIKVEETAPRYNLVKFSDGREFGTVGAGGKKGYHRVFNKEAGAFTHIGTNATPIGTTTFADDGTNPTIVSEEIIEKPVKYYNIITDKHYNIFANGILTSCRLSNKYHIKDMKYVGESIIHEQEEKEYCERLEKNRKWLG